MSNKKNSKTLLPKRIAGVKVPKSVRRGRFSELLASKTGQALIAEAITAAGAFGAAKKASASPKARSFVHAAETVRSAGDTDEADVGSAREVLAYALGEAVRSFADALRNGHNGAPQAELEPDCRTGPDAPLEGVEPHPKPSYEAGPL